MEIVQRATQPDAGALAADRCIGHCRVRSWWRPASHCSWATPTPTAPPRRSPAAWPPPPPPRSARSVTPPTPPASSVRRPAFPPIRPARWSPRRVGSPTSRPRHQPLRQHRDPADHLHAVRQSRWAPSPCRRGSPAATRSPIRSSTRRATSTWPPTTDKLTKFSPTGTLLWSVDPEGGNPTGIFSVGTGSGFQLVVSVVQDKSASEWSTRPPGR